MSKSTMGNKLPRKLEQKMQTVGEQIRLARLASTCAYSTLCNWTMTSCFLHRKMRWGKSIATRLGIAKREMDVFWRAHRYGLQNRPGIIY
jgi:hypothetical protein